MAALRAERGQSLPGVDERVVVGTIDGGTRWNEALAGVDAVVHLAARSHVLRERAADPEAAYRETNVEGTRALLEAAIDAGVTRFVLMSSIKVNGERTTGRAFAADHPPAPEDAYGRTKRAAESLVLAAREATDVAVVRAPLVYGPGVKGNFLALLDAVRRERALPLGRVRNRRSLLYVDNLCSALLACLEHPGAAGEVFIASDGEAVSTPELVRRLAGALGVRPRLVPAPVWTLRLAGALTGRGATIARLTGSLEVDDGKLRDALGWSPAVDLADGLRRTAGWYLATG